MEKYESPLERFYHWEKTQPNKTFFRQAYQGQWLSVTWAQAGTEIRKMANYLKSLNLPEHSKIAIISKNSMHWIMSDLAIMMSGHISVPLYPTIPGDLIKYCLEHSETKVCFVGKLDNWKTQAHGIPDGVKVINFPMWSEYYDGYINWEDIMKNTEPLMENPIPNPDDLITIIYTSGTTGLPKGVLHRYGAIGFAAANAMKLLDNLSPADRFFSYLPLSHIAERMLVEMGSIYSGGTMSFAESLETFPMNLKETKPTVFLAVPRIWTKFQMGILAKMNQNKLDLLMRIPIVNNLIKKKIKEGLGLENAKYLLSGAAPLPVATTNWFDHIGFRIYEAYAMTENCAYSHLSLPNSRKVGSVGCSLPFNEVRFSEEGEIQVKSDAIMVGYYKEPEKTRETITEDGWLCTGDQGVEDNKGFLTITGRVKDIFKTDKGKYVAPAPIENELSKSTLIEQVCVVGANLPQTMALVVLSEEAKGKNKNEVDKELEELATSVNKGLEKHERMKKVVIMNEEWTVENNLLTPTLKVKRNILEKQKQDAYQNWYQQKESVVWE
ncbi:MAG: AMP-binding protein [Chitinophagales bacterium]|nr:AMP-binding protein [Chitinophagales bacterium]